MYVCDYCKRNIGPNLPRTLVPVEFKEDRQGHKQIQREKAACPLCLCGEVLKLEAADQEYINIRTSLVADKKTVMPKEFFLEKKSSEETQDAKS